MSFIAAGGKRRNEEVASPLKINECGGKRSGSGQPIGAGPQGAAGR